MRPESVWLATADLPVYPAVSGDVEVDVAVVGGGLVGLTTGLLLRLGGARRVAVLEADQIGGGTTGHTTGKVTTQHGLIYASLTDRLGVDSAQVYAEANQAGLDLVARLTDEHRIECDLTRAPALAYTQDQATVAAVEAEAEAAQRAGLSASLTDTIDLPIEIAAAVRFDDQVHLHAGRYVAGLARAGTDAGGEIYEHTRVIAVEEQDDRTVQLTTTGGIVRANQVVVATLLLIGTLGGYFAKARPNRSYGLAVRLHSPAPPSIAISADSPTRSTRPWLDPGPNGLIVVGNGHETGTESRTDEMYDDLERWTRQTFDVDSVEYRWSAQDFTTPDRVPYVGRCPLTHMVFVATGFQKWGLTNGTAAAIMLTDLLNDRQNPWLSVFDSTRIGNAKSVAGLVKDNLKVGKHLVTGQLDRFGAPPADELAPGTGGAIRLDGDTVGGYRDVNGRLHTVTLTCTHLGCRLAWNPAETSWDCPCHGSRFDVDGQILDGPAVHPLKAVDTGDT